MKTHIMTSEAQAKETHARTPQHSVIVPLGPRHEDLEQICHTLRQVLQGEFENYEVIFVDDATGPEVRAALQSVVEQFPEVHVVKLQRQMGDAVALAVGAQAARGEILLTLDPYLHVSLDELPRLLRALEDDVDVVCAWRWPRQDHGPSRWASDSFNAIARWLSGVEVHDLNCRTRVMRREVIEELPIYGELQRFIPIFAARRGYECREVQVPQQPGKSELGSQNLASYLRRFLDLLTLAFLTRFVNRPLHFFGLAGVATAGLGFLINLSLSYQKLVLGSGIGHRPLLLLAMLLIVVGIQLASVGLLGELMIFTHARELKEYVVKERRG